ncbi:hypothetical protein U1Q18_016555 [Sarracenia purpurea var. burkii]
MQTSESRLDNKQQQATTKTSISYSTARQETPCPSWTKPHGSQKTKHCSKTQANNTASQLEATTSQQQIKGTEPKGAEERGPSKHARNKPNWWKITATVSARNNTSLQKKKKTLLHPFPRQSHTELHSKHQK